MADIVLKPCWLFHNWLMRVREKTVVYPKLGPFDPRSDEERTYTYEIDICAKCGQDRETKAYGHMCP